MKCSAVWALAALLLGLSLSAFAQQTQLPFPNACSQPSCRDTDGDGFCDSWEHAQRIPNGPLLPGADPAKPDIYLWYDWMDYGAGAESPFSCSTDGDCRSRLPQDVHVSDRCVANVCQHTHDPVAVDPTALDFVVARFAAHGINLHLLRGKAQPHSQVVTFRRDAEMQLSCEGASIDAGTAGPGKYAVSLYDLEPAEASPLAYHYVLFGHLSGCDNPAHCPATPGNVSTCSDRWLSYGQTGWAKLSGNEFIVSLGAMVNVSGLSPRLALAGALMHELGHNLGLRHDGHIDRPCSGAGTCSPGETCIDLNDGQGSACHEAFRGVIGAEEPNYKPNYLSVMNYRYARGIEVAAVTGSRVAKACSADSDCGADGGMCIPPRPGAAPRPKTCSMSGFVCGSDSDCDSGESCTAPTAAGTCVRVDYSRQTLPIGGPTPGALDETNLDDTAGLGSGTTDIFRYTDAMCHICSIPAPATGRVNWMGSGLYTTYLCDLFRLGPESFDDRGVHADIDSPTGSCDEPRDVLHGHTDWPDLSGIPFNYKFQCRAAGNIARGSHVFEVP
jgi:hypothetical protein